MCHKILQLSHKGSTASFQRFRMSNTLHTMNNYQHIVLATNPHHE